LLKTVKAIRVSLWQAQPRRGKAQAYASADFITCPGRPNSRHFRLLRQAIVSRIGHRETAFEFHNLRK
jgi:hypothetical protein